MLAFETDLLAELVGKKHDLLAQMRDLGRRQTELIEADDLGQLLKVLAAKQRLLAALQAVEQRLLPFRGQDPEGRQWRSAEDRRRCAQVAARTEVILGEIVQQEKQSEAELTLRRDEAAARLDTVHTAAHARGAYANQPLMASGQLDLLSET
jgi:hypothetical protein